MPPEVKVNLHPVNFIILSGILQSVILSVVLLLHKKGNRRASILMALFVLICSFHFSWSLFIDLNLPDLIKQIFWFPYSYLLTLGPLLFFYTRSLSEPGFSIRTKDLLHFFPVVAEVSIQLFFIIQSIKTTIVHYAISGFLLFRVMEFTATAVSILWYGKLSLAHIRRYESTIAQHFSFQKNITLLWLLRMIKYLRVLWLFWLAFELAFMIFLRFQMHFIPVYLLLYILLGVIVYSNYWIAVQTLNKSESWLEQVPASQPPESKNVYSRLTESEINESVSKLQQLMHTEKMYLHETLTLRMLAVRLDMDPNQLSYVLNNALQKTFYDYVNEFRIHEVIRKIDDPAYAHLKIVEIAYECGFNSKATFNRVFKKLTGKSPSDYRKPG